jgi:hypothetical protein
MAVGPDARAAGPGPARERPYFTNIAGRTQLSAAGPPFEMRPIAITRNIKRRDGICRILSSAAIPRTASRQAGKRPGRLIRHRLRAAADNIGLFSRIDFIQLVYSFLFAAYYYFLWRQAARRDRPRTRIRPLAWHPPTLRNATYCI